MSQIRGLPFSPPSLLQPCEELSSSHGCPSPLPQEAQPIYQAETLCPDKGGGEKLPDLGNYHAQLLVRHGSPDGSSLGSQLGLGDTLDQVIFDDN